MKSINNENESIARELERLYHASPDKRDQAGTQSRKGGNRVTDRSYNHIDDRNYEERYDRRTGREQSHDYDPDFGRDHDRGFDRGFDRGSFGQRTCKNDRSSEREHDRYYENFNRQSRPGSPLLSSFTLGILAASAVFGVSFSINCLINTPPSISPASFSSPFVIPNPNPNPSFDAFAPSFISSADTVHRMMQAGEVNAKKSTITGIIDSDSMTASLYWTFVLKNNNSSDKEASILIDLPSNSALSRATLWVNGVAQEAAFASNSLVSNAYDRIVVRHRDPMLVTQVAPNRIKILAAPVTANGGEMQIRIGMTVPVETGENGKHSISLPKIAESNLKFDSQQDVHLTSESQIGGLGSTAESGIFVLRANIPVKELSDARITVAGPSSTQFAARLLHSSPTQYIVANVENGKLRLSNQTDKPKCKIFKDVAVSSRLSNIWAHQEIEKLVAKGAVNEACEIANTFRIVSSVSGATVLETEADYGNSGLDRNMNRNMNFAVDGLMQTNSLNGAATAQSSAPMLQGATNGTIGPQGADASQAPMLQAVANRSIGPQGADASQAPVLSGATGGGIGPQGADATIITGINSSGTVRVNNLANLEFLINIFANFMQFFGVAFAVFIGAEAVRNDGVRKPFKLSKSGAITLALVFGLAAMFAPQEFQWLMNYCRDCNLFS